MRRTASLVTIAFAALVAAPTALAAPVTRSVAVKDNFFSPVAVNANPGDTIKWTNSGERAHTITRASGLVRWDSGKKDPGTTYSKLLTAAGTYSYLCAFHSGMTGRVNVLVGATPLSGTTATTFTLRVASVTAPTGFVYVLQSRKPGTTTFVQHSATTAATRSFRTTVKGTWAFRAALKQTSTGALVTWSPLRTITVG